MSSERFREDQSDEEIAKAALARAGEGSTREQAKRLPVSYGPVQGWKQGKYGMKAETKRRLVAWLNGKSYSSDDPDAAGKLAAARYMETFAAQLRREVAEATSATVGTADPVGARTRKAKEADVARKGGGGGGSSEGPRGRESA
jgi:hypothetical protein